MINKIREEERRKYVNAKTIIPVENNNEEKKRLKYIKENEEKNKEKNKKKSLTPVKKAYKVKCCNCGYVFSVYKSIMQEGFGQNKRGNTTCFKCKEFLNLTFNPVEETMTATKMDDYIKIKENSYDKTDCR